MNGSKGKMGFANVDKIVRRLVCQVVMDFSQKLRKKKKVFRVDVKK